MIPRARLLALALAAGCGDAPPSDAGPAATDAGPAATDAAAGLDAGARDAGALDAGASVAALSDAFDGDALDPAWTVLLPEAVDLSVAGGQLRAIPNRSTLWFEAQHGPLVHRRVTGDFRASATVRARTRDGAAAPSQRIHLGGLAARDPASDPSGPESYVFVVVGQDEDGLSVETKSTSGSVSTYEGPAWPSGDAELRICRVGAAFRLYRREVGGASWALAAQYDRPDLPATLQVGPILYAFSDAPDLSVAWEEVDFAAVGSAADCDAP